MSRNAARIWFVVSSFVSLTLFHVLLPTRAAQPVALQPVAPDTRPKLRFVLDPKALKLETSL